MSVRGKCLDNSRTAPIAVLTQTGKSAARFTQYLTTVLRQSYDNAEVTIDLRRTSSLQNLPRLFLGTIRLQNRKFVLNNVHKLAYDIPI